jgi:hypothetical protein
MTCTVGVDVLLESSARMNAPCLRSTHFIL